MIQDTDLPPGLRSTTAEAEQGQIVGGAGDATFDSASLCVYVVERCDALVLVLDQRAGKSRSPLHPVLTVTPKVDTPTYPVMELADDELIGLFAGWRAEIDSVPFAHDAEWDVVTSALLSDGGHRAAYESTP